MRKLFLDTRDVLEMSNLARKFHQAEKFPGNPVVVPDLPWERAMGHNHGTVLFEEGRFKYWYQMFAFAEEAQGTFHCGYAESGDGIRWEKPVVGTTTLNGSPENNVIAYDIGGVNIVKDEYEKDQARRYKMLYFGAGKEKKGVIRAWMGSEGAWGWCIAFSSDGKVWTPHPENPVYTAAGDDGSFLGWDPNHDCYAAYFRPCVWKPGQQVIEADGHDGTAGDLHGWYRDGPAPVDEAMKKHPYMRLIGRATSSDLVDWSPTETVIAPDEYDPPGVEFYSMPLSLYEGWYIGLVYMLYGDPNETFIRKKGLMDIQLAASRDGVVWNRMGGHRPFIPRGGRGSFDAGMVGPNAGLVEKDGMIWFYYNGWSGEHRETKAYRRANDPGLFEMGRLCSGTGLARIRQDGFISVDAGDEEGELVTREESLKGAELFINGMTRGDTGRIAVEILDEAGKPVPGFSGNDGCVFRGDNLHSRIDWGNRRLKDLPEGKYRFRFRMLLASLFSYEVK